MVPQAQVKFISPFAELLDEFLVYKRNCGYKYNGEARYLKNFDKYLASTGVNPDNCDVVHIYDWLKKREHESLKTFSIRNCLYRQLYHYFEAMGTNIFPQPPNARERILSSGFTPYIFTREQIKQIFHAIDIESKSVLGYNFHRIAALLFRMLYGTGLRINEALSLKIENVWLDRGVLEILEAKNGESRLVPMSSSLCKRVTDCILNNQYLQHDYLFQKKDGSPIHRSRVYDWFRWIIWRVRIPHLGRGKGPRLHDLRHTFAVHSLQNAVKRGIDPYAYLPMLSVYLGHKTVNATERYLRLTAEAYPDFTKDIERIMNKIIPEVDVLEESQR